MKNSRLIIKAIALILGGLAILFFGMFFCGEGIPDLRGSENFQLKSMLTLMAFSVLGYFFSFWRPKEGGMVMTFAGILMGLNMFYHGGAGDTGAALIYSLPFLIPGVMLWWVGSNRGN
ncbi:MAG: hypothetical protein JW731_14270 [Bacteroidales bacterium]|nr:hypothetical protein [Bacteroidales bacterium]